MTEPASGPVDSRPWPDGVYESLDRWRQGHILEGVPLLALGSANVPPLWARASPTDARVAGLPVLAGDPQELGRVMVVSQGCDLVKTTFPFATVVPVYDASEVLSEQQQATARAGMTWHLVVLSASWATDRVWVADLRHETALDKSLLAAADPREAFHDEEGYAMLAERLAAARLRGALPDPCRDHVVTPLRKHLAGRVDDGAKPLAGVREVRVQSNHPTEPTVVTLFVVVNEGEQPDQQEWDAAFESVHEAAAAAGISLYGPEIGSLYDMTASDYLTSHAIADADSS